ncbi:gp53-like domain-containing protein [Burkholderia multivorans]|uniref:gp53-like domain-containing protein n=1 Tax=Burkholderia multivorans TaxID=87883 RepID=UPI001C23CF68|nr:hypothetical protein [Burkholderia multivorans]MBU9246359.1 hypothetical protein [Burkholderia multivorans]
MATQNDFLPFATGPGANVVDQATYAALGALTTGFLSGTAQSGQLNKVWRQSSIMAAVLGQFIANFSGQNAIDDGTTATLLANLKAAINAAGITAPQFDNSTKHATTEFVQRALGNRQTIKGINANYTATAADVGKVIAANGAGLILTLPLSTNLPAGSVISAYANFPSGVLSFAVQGSDKLNVGGPSGQLLTSTSIYYGEGCDWITDSAGNWYAVGRSAFLGNTGSFASSLASSGYQKLPSGLILQWGTWSTTTASTQSNGMYEGNSVTNFPIAFPNKCFFAEPTPFDVGGQGLGESSWVVGPPGNSNVNILAACRNASQVMYGTYFAAGY